MRFVYVPSDVLPFSSVSMSVMRVCTGVALTSWRIVHSMPLSSARMEGVAVFVYMLS